jgi:hypothetical protein
MARHRNRALILSATAALGAFLFVLPVSAGDSPAGFWYGSDSSAPDAQGSSPPYTEPVTGGTYGGYAGEITTWSDLYCGTSGRAMNEPNVSKSYTNNLNYGVPGTSLYYYMAGPGLDPSYNGTNSEAYAWGQRQANDVINQEIAWTGGYNTLVMPVIWMDIESNSITGLSNGWNEWSKNCDQTAYQYGIPSSVDRNTFNGYFDTMTSHGLAGGVYSAPAFWNSVFGTGSYGQIPNTWEWTYEGSAAQASPGPSGWCTGSICATFFGGQSSGSSHAILWQWTINPSQGDFDQMDQNRMPAGW